MLSKVAGLGIVEEVVEWGYNGSMKYFGEIELAGGIERGINANRNKCCE